MPEGPAFYPDGELTDEPEETLMAELIREAALEGVRDELPHSLAVVIEEIVPREEHEGMLDVHALLYVERPSQKAHRHRQARCPAQRGRHGRPHSRSSIARHAHLPGSAREGGQGLAARPQAAGQTGILTSGAPHAGHGAGPSAVGIWISVSAFRTKKHIAVLVIAQWRPARRRSRCKPVVVEL